MKVGTGKMIKFVCDICKKDIERGMDNKLTYRYQNATVQWDICSSCEPKLSDLCGEGRTIWFK